MSENDATRRAPQKRKSKATSFVGKDGRAAQLAGRRTDAKVKQIGTKRSTSSDTALRFEAVTGTVAARKRATTTSVTDPEDEEISEVEDGYDSAASQDSDEEPEASEKNRRAGKSAGPKRKLSKDEDEDEKKTAPRKVRRRGEGDDEESEDEDSDDEGIDESEDSNDESDDESSDDDEEPPAVPVNHLAVGVKVGAKSTVGRIAVSGLQRTPSPFGKPMGDHSVAWAALVDSYRARLTGVSLDEAVTRMEQAHATAADVLDVVPGSAGARLMALLDPAGTDPAAVAKRRAALVDWSGRVGAALARARTAGTRGAKALHLQEAISYHLAFLNFAPGATVATVHAQRATGKGEGPKRARIVEYEDSGALDENGLDGLYNDLWGLFDGEAALRFAGVDRATMSVRENGAAHLEALGALVADLNTLHAGKLEHPAAAVKRIGAAAAAIKDANGDNAIASVAQLIIVAANSGSAVSVLPGDKNAFAALIAAVETNVGPAAAFVEHVLAPERLLEAGLALARLLHEHQSTVATAYPRTAVRSGFLGAGRPGPLKHALTELDFVLDGYSAQDKKALSALVRQEYQKYDKRFAVKPGDQNSWAKDPTIDTLVVSMSVGGELRIAGRPPAPAGIVGMGAHSTAWVDERSAVKRLVARAASPKAAMTALDRAVLADLRVDGVMQLDSLLPAAQLESGQLVEIFAAAEVVRAATTLTDKVAAYLAFRNLLPFATVQASSTTGDAEREGALDNYDEKAMTEVAGAQRITLAGKPGRDETVAALRTASRALREMSTDDPALTPLIEESRKRLSAQARALGKKPTEKGLAAVRDTILNMRTSENRRVLVQAGTLRR